MSYKLDNIDITAFGAFPFPSEGSIALGGVFNLPKRKGETERNWGTETEPYLNAEDIQFDGRNLTLSVALKGSTPVEYQNQLDAFKDACIKCKVLGTDFGDFNVVQTEDITVTEDAGYFASVRVPFWQEETVLPQLTVLPSGGNGFLLDNYDLQRDFGMVVSDFKNSRDIGKRIGVNTTLPYKQTVYRDEPTVSMACAMMGTDLTELYARMMQFHSLCARPGGRKLVTSDKRTFDLYSKDGIDVRVEHETAITFELKMKII